MSNRKKIGLLGGSFNPVHIGHLRAAEEIKENFYLDKVIFIPASVNPLKVGENYLNPDIRLEMLDIALEDNPYFELSDIEIERESPSYTIDTLKYFYNDFPNDDHYFIVGSELFSNINTWKKYKELFLYSNFIVIHRPGSRSSDKESYFPLEIKNDFRYLNDGESYRDTEVFEHKSKSRIYFSSINGIEMSSTMIRNLAGKNRSIKYLVPVELEKYIVYNKIYTEEIE